MTPTTAPRSDSFAASGSAGDDRLRRLRQALFGPLPPGAATASAGADLSHDGEVVIDFPGTQHRARTGAQPRAATAPPAAATAPPAARRRPQGMSLYLTLVPVR